MNKTETLDAAALGPGRTTRSLSVSIAAALCVAALAGAQPRNAAPPGALLATSRRAPAAYGTNAYTVTTISAMSFYPSSTYVYYSSTAELGRGGPENAVTEFYAGLDLPGGAIIDYIGLNSSSGDDFAYGVALVQRHSDGSAITIGTFSSTVHGWDTDFNSSPLGYLWQGKSGDALIINVEQGSNANSWPFGWVEVWWRRSVSPPPATASFGDVPTTDPLFQFVEALKASGITGGCSASPPLYCPDDPLTRGQMAVFLAKALGLNWSGN